MGFSIRQHQFEVLEHDVGVAELQRDVITRLAERAPGCFTVVPERAIAEVTRLGAERAERHGLTRVGPARLFVEVMILFGSDFDTDPLFPWAQAALAETHPTQIAKADRLHDVMMEYIDAVALRGHERTAAAMQRFEPIAERWLAMDVPSGALAAVIDEEARALYPERLSYLGPSAAAAAVQQWAEDAAACGKTGAAAVIHALLASLLGHGFARDPLFPWAHGRGHAGGPRELVREAAAYCERVVRFMATARKD
jgi:hypothetical protein